MTEKCNVDSRCPNDAAYALKVFEGSIPRFVCYMHEREYASRGELRALAKFPGPWVVPAQEHKFTDKYESTKCPTCNQLWVKERKAP